MTHRLNAILVAFFLAACATSQRSALEVHEHGTTDAQQSLELHGQAQTFTKTLQGATEIERGKFAPLPDGGVYLVEGERAKVGPVQTWSKADESWMGTGSGTEHAEKATDAKAAASKETRPALSCAAGGILWAIAALGAVLFAWRLLRRAA